MGLLEPCLHRPIEVPIIGFVDRQQSGIAMHIDGEYGVQPKGSRPFWRIDRRQRHHISGRPDLGRLRIAASPWASHIADASAPTGTGSTASARAIVTSAVTRGLGDGATVMHAGR